MQTTNTTPWGVAPNPNIRHIGKGAGLNNNPTPSPELMPLLSHQWCALRAEMLTRSVLTSLRSACGFCFRH
ncbi:hypothetical protein SFSGTM_10930 [Sulfuriferula nivalis]|uniref:Uncharacterized protein n=1 Tax=Sulfuriferula nivalis TaxID=2675298 RepID=A0A809RFL7_9PROT|nr:hypothetical protein SFSGTM_10930 [Sulfuriferula nivalis]